MCLYKCIIVPFSRHLLYALQRQTIEIFNNITISDKCAQSFKQYLKHSWTFEPALSIFKIM